MQLKSEGEDPNPNQFEKEKRDPNRKEEEDGKGERERGTEKPRWVSGKPFTGVGEEDRAGLAARRARPRGHRGQAARRRRGHPLGNAHAGEGAGDGTVAHCSTVFARSRLRSARCCVRREERER